jgi:hypothetical protein
MQKPKRGAPRWSHGRPGKESQATGIQSQSGPTQLSNNRRKLLKKPSINRDVRNTPPLPPPQQSLHTLLGGPRQHSHRTSLSQRSRSRPDIPLNPRRRRIPHRNQVQIKLDLINPSTSSRPKPIDHHISLSLSSLRPPSQRHDVSLPSGKIKQLGPSTSQQQPRPVSSPSNLSNSVSQPSNTLRTGPELTTQPLRTASRIRSPGTQTQLEPTAGQGMQSLRLPRKQPTVPIGHSEHERAEVQPGGRSSDRGQGGERVMFAQRVRGDHGVVAKLLGSPGKVGQCVDVRCVSRDDTEAEWTIRHYGSLVGLVARPFYWSDDTGAAAPSPTGNGTADS